MRLRRPTAMQAASTAALLLASALFVAALWSALHTVTVPLSPQSSGRGPVVLAGEVRSDAMNSAAEEAELANDPFDPQRTGVRRNPRPSLAARDTTARQPAAVVRLLGTVVRTNGSFALCQVQADPPQIVHVGEQLGDLVLLSIDQGRAAFRRRDGARIELTLTTPGT